MDGTLNIALVNGYNPTPQQSFTILKASSISGAFSHVTGGTLTYTANSIIAKPTITPDTLTVTVNPATGGGTVTPGFIGSSARNLGFTYKITASPARGMSFSGWTGSITSTDPALTFTMTPGMTLEANFVPTAFLPAVGTYTSIAEADDGSGAGYFTIAVTKSGAFTAKLLAAGVTYAFSGQFTGSGAYQQSLVIGGHTVGIDLQLDVAQGSSVTGNIGIDSTVDYPIDAARAAFSKSNPAPEAGGYTFYFPPNSGDATLNIRRLRAMAGPPPALAPRAGSM